MSPKLGVVLASDILLSALSLFFGKPPLPMLLSCLKKKQGLARHFAQVSKKMLGINPLPSSKLGVMIASDIILSSPSLFFQYTPLTMFLSGQKKNAMASATFGKC